MSKSRIMYAQANPLPGQELKDAGGDLFIMWINRAFGQFPVELDKNHIERLEGMNAVQSGVGRPFDELIRAIRRYGAIKVWCDYENG